MFNPFKRASGHKADGNKAGGPPIYTDPLPSEPEAITRAYWADHAAWINYGYADYRKTDSPGAAETAYDHLIDHYCGPEKSHQLIVLNPEPMFAPERTEITGHRDTEDGRIICVGHTDTHGDVLQYEFMFLRDGAIWRLSEISWFDEFGEEWLPCL